ncbi:hypothetical protein NHH03_05900 [Stieleria sp. TO1_6]|uniref:hypothetical protein n=1 Tax=Stieleria tagensis TaxID=2956795 RepID=UPI00209B01E3|nr:hypothetical protein [Stieleria tagensis]MCO8121263.1 hypothetical protein [Stieleria tagensis]
MTKTKALAVAHRELSRLGLARITTSQRNNDSINESLEQEGATAPSKNSCILECITILVFISNIRRKCSAMYRFLAFLVLSAVCAQAFAAPTIVFDFESIDLQGNSNFPITGPISLTEQNLTMTISHENDLEFAFNRRSGLAFNESFGFQAFSTFGDSMGQSRFDPGAFILDFDTAIESISVDMGDFGVEADNLLIQGFSSTGGTGLMIDEDTGFVPDINGFHFDTVQISGTGIRSVRIIGGSPDVPNSVFYDNITVELSAVPEPGTAVFLIALAAVSILTQTRRRRAACCS